MRVQRTSATLGKAGLLRRPALWVSLQGRQWLLRSDSSAGDEAQSVEHCLVCTEPCAPHKPWAWVACACNPHLKTCKCVSTCVCTCVHTYTGGGEGERRNAGRETDKQIGLVAGGNQESEAFRVSQSGFWFLEICEISSSGFWFFWPSRTWVCLPRTHVEATYSWQWVAVTSVLGKGDKDRSLELAEQAVQPTGELQVQWET